MHSLHVHVYVYLQVINELMESIEEEVSPDISVLVCVTLQKCDLKLLNPLTPKDAYRRS